MRRRICLMGAALSAGPLAFGVAPAWAATNHKTTHKPKPIKTTCMTNVAISIAPGQSQVVPPSYGGHEYGSAICGNILGSGVQSDKFTVPDSGDTLATFTLYLRTGTVYGKYDLTPQQSSFNFLATDYLGTLTITGGSGTFHGVTGTGKMTCSSIDGVHTSCKDKLKFKLKPVS